MRKPATLLMAGALVLSMSGAVGASTPTASNVIKGCVNKTTKIVRLSIYASPTFCKSTEVYRFWNVTGPKGAPGTNGTNGTNGTDGDSGYQVAQDNGFLGTELEWLDSLVGPKGDKGDPGTDGTNGTNGTNGTDGDSGYQVALDNGFLGTAQEWLDSIVGPKGDKGDPGTDGTNGTNGTDGAKGDKGDTGAPGGLNGVTRATGTTDAYGGNENTGATVTATATCPSGTKLVTGGGDVSGNNLKHYAAVTSSFPSSATTWTVIATIVAGTNANGNPPSLTAYALCAS
jgi:hypothetical protein